ncbi:MAG: hypothetical protein R3C26_22640 [Calditrichia bacterium]
MRKNPLTPWLTPEMVDKIRNFETVLNAYHPDGFGYQAAFQRKTMRLISALR